MFVLANQTTVNTYGARGYGDFRQHQHSPPLGAGATKFLAARMPGGGMENPSLPIPTKG